MSELQHRSAAKQQPRAARTEAAPTPEPEAAATAALPGLAVRRKMGLDAIQAPFGQHDFSNVVAHAGSAAGQLGAAAFATGQHIALGEVGGALPHEAAHVVQQRAGRVHPLPEAGIPSVLEQDEAAVSGHPAPRADAQR